MTPLSVIETEAILAQVGIYPGTRPELWRIDHGAYRFVGPRIGRNGDKWYVGAIRRKLFDICSTVQSTKLTNEHWCARLSSNSWQSISDGITEAHALVLAGREAGLLK